MMTFSNATSQCPCCKRQRSAHTKAQQAKCSAWTKLNTQPARKAKSKRVTRASADGFARLIHQTENN